MNVLIAYHSDYGNTEKMAKAIASGIRAANPDVDIKLRKADVTSPDDLVRSDKPQ